MNLDTKIVLAEHTVSDAKDRGDTRALHAAIAKLMDLRHRRMRRDRKRGLFKPDAEAAAGVFITVASVVLTGMIGLMDEPAYAADGISLADIEHAANFSFQRLAAGSFVVIAAVLLAFALQNMSKRRQRTGHEMFPDPDKRPRDDHRHWGL